MELNKNIVNIDDEDVSPASRTTNPHGIFFDFLFKQPTKPMTGNTGLSISDDCLTGNNHGAGWRTLIGDKTLNLYDNPGKYYFDIKINSITSNWGNSLGVADKLYTDSTVVIVGYASSVKSWSWFTYPAGKDGFLHDGKNTGEKPIHYKSGDVLKIVIETGDKSISFYKNDEFIAKPFIDIETDEIVPAFTLCGADDSITILK